MLFVTFNNTLIADTKKRLESAKDYIDNKDKHYIRILNFSRDGFRDFKSEKNNR